METLNSKPTKSVCVEDKISKEFCAEAYKCVTNCVKTANQLPVNKARVVYTTYPSFISIMHKFRDNTLEIINGVFETEKNRKIIKRNDDGGNMEAIIDYNDALLDKINTNMDIMMGTRAVSAPEPFINKPIIVKRQFKNTSIIMAENIERPQEKFKVKIDNHSFWLPNLQTKQNSIVPYVLNVEYDLEQREIGYNHPYETEIKSSSFHSFLHPAPKDSCMPPPIDVKQCKMITTKSELDHLVKHLLTVDVCAVDVEQHSYRSYQGITCLVQISTADSDFIIDTLALRSEMQALNEVFTSPRILKIFHGADSDIEWLQRDFSVYVVGIFDTFQAAKALNFPTKSLKYLLQYYCNIEADKKYQLADWRIRPLPDEMLLYAAMDTHYLIYIYNRMKTDLLSRDTATLLQTVFANSKSVCLHKYIMRKKIHENAHLKLYSKSRKQFGPLQLAGLKKLFEWRDRLARTLDESPSYVLPDQKLLKLAEVLPNDIRGIEACCFPSPPVVKQNLPDIRNIIRDCLMLGSVNIKSGEDSIENLNSIVSDNGEEKLPHEHPKLICPNSNGVPKKVSNKKVEYEFFRKKPEVHIVYDDVFSEPYVRLTKYRSDIVCNTILSNNSEFFRNSV